MTTAHVFIAASLDGYIAGKNHELDWLNEIDTTGEDLGYERFMARIDGLVMGRNSYNTVKNFPEWSYDKPVMVLSHTLTQDNIPARLHDKVELTRLPPRQIMAELKTRSWNRVYIDGGVCLQSFLADDLIEDIILTTIPILLGSGIPLFGTLPQNRKLDLINSVSFDSGLVQSHYRVLHG